MRVQLITKAGPGMTGTTRYADGLRRGLEEAGVEVSVVSPRLRALPRPVLRCLKRGGVDLEAFFASYPLRCRTEPADVYHITTQTMATLLWLQRFPEPVVVSVLDVIPWLVRGDPELDSFRHWIDRLFYRLALGGLRRADGLVAISEYTKRTLVRALGLPEARIRVVYPGLDGERFRPLEVPEAFRARYRLGEAGRYVLYVGSEEPRKNLVTLVRAFARVKPEVPGLKLVKVGASHSTEGRRRLLALVKELGLEREVLFFDSVPDEDLSLFYNAADVLAMPSLYEGFGLPLVEAMACGTPVVCADATSLPEVAGGSGLTVQPLDVEAWARAMASLMEDGDQRQELRHAGMQRARTFTAAETAGRMTAVYETAVANG